MLLVCSWAKWLTQLELVLVSYYHESTRSVTTLSGWDANPLQGYPPPPSISSGFPGNELAGTYLPVYSGWREALWEQRFA